ncbi:hypothetical protein HaLaN_03739 [Haematococcus lacustris]|uniref:Uncharacterized protein n=1 Tax=Haematococcus lacustris TaxID=44745 RepID=A0A699YHP2_HAELA|nr:hypothetical protein HaLaN_03739 [Haematococcus lacustris]
MPTLPLGSGLNYELGEPDSPTVTHEGNRSCSRLFTSISQQEGTAALGSRAGGWVWLLPAKSRKGRCMVAWWKA